MARQVDLSFPVSVGPFTMSTCNVGQAINSFYQQHQFPKPDPQSEEPSMAGLDPLSVRMGQGEIIFFQLSPLFKITLDNETKDAANIKREAEFFAWAYPAVDDGSGALNGSTPEHAFLKFGGYVYLNNARSVVGTNSITPVPLGTLGLMFGRGQVLATDVADKLMQQGRFQEVTLPDLIVKGATHFAWIRPEEFANKVASSDGGFAYKFQTGPSRYFPVVSKPVFTAALLEEELEAEESWIVVQIPHPMVERFVIFSKGASFIDNIRNSEVSSLVSEEEVVVMCHLVERATTPIPYAEWQTSMLQGTLQDPWIMAVQGGAAPAALAARAATSGTTTTGTSQPIPVTTFSRAGDDPCIDAACTVQVIGFAGGYKRVGELVKGDVVAGPDGLAAEVVCLVRAKCQGGRAALVELPGGVRVTPYHPVLSEGAWRFPAELAEQREMTCEAVCSLVLRGAPALLVFGDDTSREGVACVALGHGLRAGAAEHPYLSTAQVIKDLEGAPGYGHGMVDVLPRNIVRDAETGLMKAFCF